MARLFTASRTGGRALRCVLAWLETSLFGDAIALLCLWGTLYALSVLAGVLP